MLHFDSNYSEGGDKKNKNFKFQYFMVIVAVWNKERLRLWSWGKLPKKYIFRLNTPPCGNIWYTATYYMSFATSLERVLAWLASSTAAFLYGTRWAGPHIRSSFSRSGPFNTRPQLCTVVRCYHYEKLNFGKKCLNSSESSHICWHTN